MQAVAQDLRVAIIGAGPAGLYAADSLLARDGLANVRVDIFDRLPTPFGLVRYGVAPDHLSIRSVRDTLDRSLDAPGLRFFGGVEIGDDEGCLALDTLRSHYDAVICTYGAATDRPLGIPGEDLPGSISATDFVRWYTGHPDTDPHAYEQMLSQARSVAVLGVGNVAVDVARVLAKTRDELEHTDMPEHVLTALEASGIQNIYLIGRRGPAEAAWTTKELRELGELQDTEVRVDPADLELGPSSAQVVAESKVAARNVAVVEEWSERERSERGRLMAIRFYARPVAIEGDDSGVRRLILERTRLTDQGAVEGTGEQDAIEVDVVIRSVGYRGTALEGVPFDSGRGVIPNVDGRVLDGADPVVGLYTAGWIKRGPSGIIGTNKKDAVQTIDSLMADLADGVLPRRLSDEDIVTRLGADHVDVAGWRRIDAAERALGATRSRDRTTIHDRSEAMTIGVAR